MSTKLNCKSESKWSIVTGIFGKFAEVKAEAMLAEAELKAEQNELYAKEYGAHLRAIRFLNETGVQADEEAQQQVLSITKAGLKIV